MTITVLWTGRPVVIENYMRLIDCRLIFLWLAVPWLQAELDSFRDTFNNSKRRSDKHKIIPQGRAPDYIRKYPEQFDTRDYKVSPTSLH